LSKVLPEALGDHISPYNRRQISPHLLPFSADGGTYQEVVTSSSRALGIMRKAGKIFQNPDVLETCFRSYVLSRLEYCAPVWGSTVSCHLRLLDGVVHKAAVLCRATTLCELSHRRNVSFLYMLYKIYANGSHHLNRFLVRFVPCRVTRLAIVNHPSRFEMLQCHTEQFKCCFLPSTLLLWNSLDGFVFEGVGLCTFKHRVNSHLLQLAD
jgi:hypothetical protein